jgi:hypothetical protein
LLGRSKSLVFEVGFDQLPVCRDLVFTGELTIEFEEVADVRVIDYIH